MNFARLFYFSSPDEGLIFYADMDPSNQPEKSGQPKRPLPPELAFLTHRPDFSQMEDDDLIAHLHNQHALIRQHADLIRDYGLDPDALIAFTAPALAQAEQAIKDCDAAQEKMLHALADKADAERNLFQVMKQIVEVGHAEHPFDETMQEAKEFVDEWSKQMPKE
jgi:hypothetical protein